MSIHDNLIETDILPEKVDTQPTNYYDTYDYTILWLERILHFVVLAANIFLIFIICKNKRLKTRINVYILNCAVLNVLLSMLILLSKIALPLVFEQYRWIIYDISIEGEITLRLPYISFAFLMTIDWFISSWRPHLMLNYNKYYKYVFLGLYIVFLMEGLIAALLDTPRYYSHHVTSYVVFNIVYIIGLFINLVINILGRKMNVTNLSTKTTYSLTVSNIIIFSHLPELLVCWVFFTVTDESIHKVLGYVDTLSRLILDNHSILIIYVLGKGNKHFKTAYNQCLKKSHDTENLDVSDGDSCNRYNNEPKIDQ